MSRRASGAVIRALRGGRPGRIAGFMNMNLLLILMLPADGWVQPPENIGGAAFEGISKRLALKDGNLLAALYLAEHF